LAREEFVAAGPGGGRWVEPKAEHSSGFCRKHRRLIAHRQDPVEPVAAERFDGLRDPVKPDGNRAVAPWIFKHMAAVRGEREIDAKPPRGLRENPDLVTGRGGEEQEPAGHCSYFRAAGLLKRRTSRQAGQRAVRRPRRVRSPGCRPV